MSVRLPTGMTRLYQGYAYSYPHKLAYRDMPARHLSEVWAGEDRANRFVYVHVPFCEMRCGFCNLLTLANPDADLADNYLKALEMEARITADAVGAADGPSPARIAIGGGTPTYLEPSKLGQLFDVLEMAFGATPGHACTTVETSPKTATPERLGLLRDRGVWRLSIGAQSFVETENRDIGRPQRTTDLERALECIRARDFPSLNIDLIYGAPSQTAGSWEQSLRAALHWRPEEMYLYPLYIRPGTGLEGRMVEEEARRLALYRQARDFLVSEGYVQRSMRSFMRRGAEVPDDEYTCQEDGMLGLGPGARSYTTGLHYSTEFAVARASVLGIVGAYCARDADGFAHIRHGIELDRDERMRRDVLKSILRTEGLDRARFAARFGCDAVTALPDLGVLADYGLVEICTTRIVPTEAGLECSDAIGPWLYSDAVRRRIDESAVL